MLIKFKAYIDRTNLLNVGFRLGVERAIEVSLVSLEITRSTNWVLLIVRIDTASGEDREMDLFEEAAIGEVEGTNDIASNSLLLVVLTPIDIWATGTTRAIIDI